MHIKQRRILDPIYGLISLNPVVSAFIDTPHFQRLRNLKQLGAAYYVFPGATHNRFEHCIGTAHLAGLVIERLRREQPELGIDDRDILCTKLAGLCHDLGHGPFSHVFDGLFIPRALPHLHWTHELASEMMLDDLVSDPANEIDLPQSDIEFIKALIRGEPTPGQQEKPFLFQIVANKKSGLDVDKFDYIARDSRNLGINCSYDTARLIESCRVIDDDICYEFKEIYNVYEVFHTRYSLHKRIYNHKTANAIEYMIVDALIEADPFLGLSESIHDPKRYLYMTDSVLEDIERSTDEKLCKARHILSRIRRRDLYKCVDQYVYPSSLVSTWDRTLLSETQVAAFLPLPCPDPSMSSPDDDPSAVVATTTTATTMKERGKEGGQGGKNVHESDIIVSWTNIHFGMKQQNPLQFVAFYSYRNLHESFLAAPEHSSCIWPKEFMEVMLSCFTKSNQIGQVQTAFRAARLNFLDQMQLLESNPIIPTRPSTPIPLPQSDSPAVRKSCSPSLPITTTTTRSLSRKLSNSTSFNNNNNNNNSGSSSSAHWSTGENAFWTIDPKTVLASPKEKNKALFSPLQQQQLQNGWSNTVPVHSRGVKRVLEKLMEEGEGDGEDREDRGRRKIG